MHASAKRLSVSEEEPLPEPAPQLTGFRRLRRGGALFGASQLTGMALGFLSGMVLVRVATKADVAFYLLLQQAIMAVSLVLQLGLGPAALRFAPITRGRGGERTTAMLRWRLFVLQIGLWTIVIPILALVWPRIARSMEAPELARATSLLLGAAMLISFGHLLDSYLRAFRMYATSAPLTHIVPRGLVLLGFLTLGAVSSGTVPWELLASIYVGSLFVTEIAYAFALPSTTPEETSEPRTAHAPPGVLEILGTSTPMGLRSAASIFYVASSLWILSWASTKEEVAIYGVAAALVQILSAIPSMASFVIPQEFSLLHADGRTAEMERLARTAATFVAALSATSLVGLLLLGRPLIRLAYGADYVGAWGILLVLAIGTLWDTFSGSAGFVLQMTGHHVLLLLFTLGGGVLNVILSLTLAPRWGGYGIALASSITLVAFNVATVSAVRRLVGVRTFVYLKPSEWIEALRLIGTGREAGEPR
ncbi:MAG TPA: polysaccharide biosynthesis C-terminal domain-containing protein [Thermoanaerobaculia bacterium]|nr:polysaccharide biosynthesis C-terminal domain-containing protein [Thermoanaerobaculia bacterium]